MYFIDNVINEVSIENNNFIQNSAIEGGAIKWIQSLPTHLENNTYQSNTAVYAPNVASFPLKLSLNIYNLNGNIIFNNNLSNIVNLPNMQSGGSIPYCLNFALLDYYNQIVRSVSES